MPAEGLEGVAELVDGAAIELAHRHELVARLHDGVERQELCRMARCHRERCRAAFECGDLALECPLGGVHDAGIDVAEGTQREEIGGVLHVVEDEGRGLVDRRDARTRGRVGGGARVQCQRVETRCSLSHCRLPLPDAERDLSAPGGNRQLSRSSALKHPISIPSPSWGGAGVGGNESGSSRSEPADPHP
jgi:hypothetical protein